jgi:hypothetical protein
VEKCNEGPRIVVFTLGGARTWVDVTNGGKQVVQWVWKSTGPMPTFDPQKKKETYQRARKEVIGQDWGTSTSHVPHIEDHVVPEKPIGKVGTLREFLRSCVELMKYEIALSTLCDMIDHCTQGRETHIAQRMVNRVLHRKRTNGEFRFNVQIGEYDVDNFNFDLGSNVNVLPKQISEMMGKPKLVWSHV